MPGGDQAHIRSRSGGGSGDRGQPGTGTATKAAVAVVGLVDQDLRDRDGVTRPLLRAMAARLVRSGRHILFGVGDRYLRLDSTAGSRGLVSVSARATDEWPLLPAATPDSQTSDDRPVDAVVDDVGVECEGPLPRPGLPI